jgi:hypothetical protein
MAALIGGEEDGSGSSDDPADFAGRGGAGSEIGGDAAFLRFPGAATIETEFNFPAGPNTPGIDFDGSEDDDAALGKFVAG